jgi:hypothetical protein
MKHFFSLLYLLLCPFASASLKFTPASGEVVAEVDQDFAIVEFTFLNKGKQAIAISEVKSPCGLCLSAKIGGGTRDPKTGHFIYAPGEKGQLEAKFKIGIQSGVIDKKLQLYQAGDPEERPSISLDCKIIVPQLIEVIPSTLRWKVGEMDEKVAKIQVLDGHKYEVSPPSFVSPAFETSFLEIEKGRTYEFRVRPKSKDQQEIAVCYFLSSSKNPKFSKLRLHLNVAK